jgi:sugar phosphate isomerase/epimerase
MARAYSMAYLTSAPLGPLQAIELAASLGYAHVGLRIAPASAGGECAPLIADAALLDAVRASLAASGVTVFDVEIVRLAADFAVDAVRPFLDVCGKLDAKAVLVAGDDPDEGRLTASFAAFCEAALDVGVTADLEFMPWTAVPDCRTARRIVEAAGQPNGRILVDSLHAARSATTLAELAALPRGVLSYAQICDAPGEIPTTVEGLIHTARCARLLPGDGGIDLKAMFAALPQDLPVSIEIPNDVGKSERGVTEWAREALARARMAIEPATV